MRITKDKLSADCSECERVACLQRAPSGHRYHVGRGTGAQDVRILREETLPRNYQVLR